jgi:long-chain acyl-CoA synthetase
MDRPREASSATPLAERLWSLCQVDRAARAVCSDDSWWTWGELTDAAQALDAELTRSGAGTAQRVGLVLENQPEFVAALLAVLGRDRCLTTISPIQPTGRLLGDIRAAKLGLLIATPAVWERLAGEKLDLRGYLLNPDGSVELARDEPLASDLSPGTAVEILTSGTTGPPKRVRLGYQQMYSSLRSADHYGQVDLVDRPRLSSGVGIITTPIVHIGALFGVLQALDNGRQIVLLERFRVQTWAAAIERYRPRITGLVPAAIQMVLDAAVPPQKLASLRAVNSGAASLPPNLADAFTERYGVPVLSVYGATEFCGAIAGWTLREHRENWSTKRGSVGRAQPGVRLRVIGEDGKEVPTGAIGQLQVQTPQAAGGAAQWTGTNDLARLDADGFLYIEGRADHTIVRGGFKVQPSTVVRVLESHPAVQEAAVAGLPDRRLGHVPVAAVQVRRGAQRPSSRELEDLCRAELLPYEVPVAIQVRDELPRTPSLKVSNVELLELFTSPEEGLAG